MGDHRLGYIPALDGIRAIAILLVLLFHARVPGFQGAFIGVDVFFVLSGYLITCLLAEEYERTGRIAILAFYGRRLRRLYPALLTMLAVYLMVSPWVFPSYPMATHWRDAGIASLYLSDYAAALWGIPERIGHTWSLSVEEHFYLVWPAVLLLVLRLPRAVAAYLVLLLAVLSTIWRFESLQIFDSWATTYVRFDTRTSGLFLGAAIGLWKPNVKRPGLVAVIGACGLVIVVSFAMLSTDMGVGRGILLGDLSAACLLLGYRAIPGLGHPVMAWIGRMSYGFYLWHYLFVLVLRAENASWQTTLLVTGLSGLACAAMSYYTVESLFRRKRLLPVEDQRDIVDVAVEVRARGTTHIHERIDAPRA